MATQTKLWIVIADVPDCGSFKFIAPGQDIDTAIKAVRDKTHLPGTTYWSAGQYGDDVVSMGPITNSQRKKLMQIAAHLPPPS